MFRNILHCQRRLQLATAKTSGGIVKHWYQTWWKSWPQMSCKVLNNYQKLSLRSQSRWLYHGPGPGSYHAMIMFQRKLSNNSSGLCWKMLMNKTLHRFKARLTQAQERRQRAGEATLLFALQRNLSWSYLSVPPSQLISDILNYKL